MIKWTASETWSFFQPTFFKMISIAMLTFNLLAFRTLPTLAIEVAWGLGLLCFTRSIPKNPSGTKNNYELLSFYLRERKNIYPNFVYRYLETLNQPFFFSIMISSIFWALSNNTTNSFSSRAPTSNWISSFNPSSNRVHMLVSINTISRTYLLSRMNSLSYSATILWPYFNSSNSLFYLSK